MYCSACGKKNPDGAKFCAFCGAKLFVDTDSEPEMGFDAPDWGAESRFDAPVHPDERMSAPVKQTPPEVQERNVWAKPAEPEETPVRPPESEKPARRWGEEKVVRANHAPSPWSKPEDTQQARRAARQGAPSTIVPVRGRESEPVQDLFFDGYDTTPVPQRKSPPPRRKKAQKPSFFEQNLRGILGIGLTLGTLLVLAAWLFLFPSGQQMLARFGMTDNPKAYAAIAQNAYEAQNYSTAAQNYYQALVLDGDNYEYALLTADSYQKSGSKGAASTALTMAIEINASDVRAYRMLQQLYPDAATRPAAVTELLNQGATLTGDATLRN